MNIMGFKSDIEIAQETTMAPITEIADKAGIDRKYLEQYGNYKAKIDYNLLREKEGEDGKLILVTAINPTPAGEGKTTTSVGLADGMSRLGNQICPNFYIFFDIQVWNQIVHLENISKMFPPIQRQRLFIHISCLFPVNRDVTTVGVVNAADDV